jgi:hypothetical protein
MVTDLSITLDAFFALIVMEAIAKPLAIRVGRWLLAHADQVAPWIPDWLHQGSDHNPQPPGPS